MEGCRVRQHTWQAACDGGTPAHEPCSGADVTHGISDALCVTSLLASREAGTAQPCHLLSLFIC